MPAWPRHDVDPSDYPLVVVSSGPTRTLPVREPLYQANWAIENSVVRVGVAPAQDDPGERLGVEESLGVRDRPDQFDQPLALPGGGARARRGHEQRLAALANRRRKQV